jgi:hypothetical protein
LDFWRTAPIIGGADHRPFREGFRVWKGHMEEYRRNKSDWRYDAEFKKNGISFFLARVPGFSIYRRMSRRFSHSRNGSS